MFVVGSPSYNERWRRDIIGVFVLARASNKIYKDYKSLYIYHNPKT